MSEPYDAYVPHRLAGWVPSPGPQTIERIGVASDSLRAWTLDAPQSRALEWCLNRAEGIASSDVEGIRTTLRSLSLLESLRAAPNPTRAEMDRQALGNVRLNAHAIAVGQRRGAPVTVVDVEEMHRRLFSNTSQQLESGYVRDEQNWVGHSHQRTPAQAHFVPPPPESVRPLLDDTLQYVSAPVWGSPIAKAALAHLQFETIHPFVDGNGRVGRALIHTVMSRDMEPSLPLPLSAAVAARKDDYYQVLQPYQTYVGDESDPERSRAASAAIDYVADAVAVACRYAQVVADVINRMEQSWTELGLRSHSAAAAVLERMSTMPAATTTFLSETTGRSPRATRRAVADLVDRGALTETLDADSGRRVFELPEMLRVVDEREGLLLDCWDLHTSSTDEERSQLQQTGRELEAPLHHRPFPDGGGAIRAALENRDDPSASTTR